MNEYELALLLKPSLTDEEVKKYIKELEKNVADKGGKVVSKDDWGRKKLSYLIKKEDTAYYFFITFSLSPSEINKLESKLKLDTNLLRYLLEKIN